MHQLLKELYNLNVTTLNEIPFGFREMSFEAILDDGKKVFVKEIVHAKRKYDRQENMRKGLALSQTFQQAPKVINTIEGDVIGNIDDRCFIVTEWVDGMTYQAGELTVKRAHNMGKTLAKFHKQVGFESSSILVDYSFDQVATEYHKNYQYFRHEPSEYGAIARAFLSMQKSVIADSLSRIEYMRNGKSFGSFWVEQVMYDENDEVVALVDWTDLPIGEADQLDDIVLGAQLSGMNKEQLIAYLSGYQKEYALSSGEMESVVWRISNKAFYHQWYLDAWLSNKENMDSRWEKSCKIWTLSAIEYYYLYDELAKSFV